MTREEAIEVIKQDIPCEHDADLIEALEMAISALEQEPTDEYMCGYNKGFDEGVEEGIKATVEPCEDAVSREEVDRILRDLGLHCAYDMPSFWANNGKDYKVIPTKWHKGYQQAVADLDKRLKELPSVTVRQTGEWKQDESDNSLTCNRCGCHLWANDLMDGNAHFCPNCGARMRD